MKLADYNYMLKISDKFENGSDRTKNGRVMSPWLSKNAHYQPCESVTSSFSVGSSWNLQIKMTFIKSQENGSDQTNSDRVTSPWLSKTAIIDLVNSVASSFFVGSSWNLQITMTCIKSRTSLKMAQIELLLNQHLFDITLGSQMDWFVCWDTVFILSIRTHQLCTILVLKFEQVQYTTRCCV